MGKGLEGTAFIYDDKILSTMRKVTLKTISIHTHNIAIVVIAMTE